MVSSMVNNRESGPIAVLLAATLFVACSEPANPGNNPGDPASPGSGGGADTMNTAGGSYAGTAGVGGPGSSTGGAGIEDERPSVLSRRAFARRLSKFEYEYSIQDVLGVSLLPAELDASQDGVPDDSGDGVFKHLADKQISIEQHALAFFQVAEAVSKRVDIAALVARLGICSEATSACGTGLIQGVGRQLYRRPLDQREVDGILSVFDSALAENLGFDAAAQYSIHALLQAPQFLFRMEQETVGTPDQPRPLDGYELAAALASFIWVSVPDDALLAAAADQSLLTPDVQSAQVSRMLADPKAERFTRVFATDFGRASYASFVGVTDADRAALNQSVVATIQDHFANQGSVADLFTTTRFIGNARVAELLGVDFEGSGDELAPIDVSGLEERVGILSHPGVLAGMGDREAGSFVNRGKYLMARLLCRNPGAVPAALSSQIEAFTADTTGLNEHERAAIRMTRPQCWGCHSQFEPLSFGLSRFDAMGRYIGEMDATGKPLPLDGWVPTGEAEEAQYTDMASYMQVLATNPVVQNCMTEHFIDFATAHSSDPVARVAAEQVGVEYLKNGSTLNAMIAAVVESPLFKTVLPSTAEDQQ